MRFDNWTANQALSTSEYTEVYLYNQPGSSIHWYGCVFQLSLTNNVLFRLTANGIIIADLDLDELNDPIRYDFDEDTPVFLKPYKPYRWALSLPEYIEVDRVSVGLKAAVSGKSLIRGFSTYIGGF